MIQRNTQTLPYFYYIDKVENPLFRVGMNWARLWLTHTAKNWEKVTMDYGTSTCSVINPMGGTRKDYRIVEQGFRLPGDRVIVVNDENVNKWREELWQSAKRRA